MPTSHNAQTITYDEIGNPLSDGVMIFCKPCPKYKSLLNKYSAEVSAEGSAEVKLKSDNLERTL